MISKLAKAKDNWFFKIISLAVAISFISLFGVSGYINSASQNQTVVKVNGQKTTQSEFNYRLQKDLNALKLLTGDDLEISDELRSSIAENVIQQIVNESVLDQTMEKYGIHFPKAFVQQVIFSRPEFQNPANGQFHPDLFKRYLSSLGMTEAEYVNSIKRIMAQKLLVTDLVQNFGIPAVLNNAIHKMDNRRKSFKYLTISPLDIKIERKISEDEIKQYYEDFAEDFMVDETRDVNVLFIPNDVILSKYATSDALVEDYFKQHQKELDQPEKRDVLQMVFLNKDDAEKALAEVRNGANFATVAKKLKAENADDATLGLVAQDELADDLAYAVFEMNVNTPQIVQVADTWQVINVKEIKAAKKAVLEDVKDQIIEQLNTDNLYDAMREARADIDDAVNAGKSLAEVGQSFNILPVKVAEVTEEELVANADNSIKDLVSSLDFNELVFSYGLDEISSAEEFDDGIAVIQISKITDAHMADIDNVKDKIVNIWTVQEKNALAKEIAENIMNDAEDGSQLANVAKARNIEVFRSAPISRNENFANLSASEINELFVAKDGEVKLFEQQGNVYVIATPFETVTYKDDLNADSLATIQQRAYGLLFSDMSKSALDSYAEGFKIKIDYDLAGFSE